MNDKDEQTTNKLVELLIKVLHDQYSSPRELALVQLVLMGDRAIQPLKAYLEKEEALQNDLEALGKQPSRLGNQKELGQHRLASEKFMEKWGMVDYNSEDVFIPRGLAIKGAPDALSLLGQNDLEISFPKIAASVYFPSKPT